MVNRLTDQDLKVATLKDKKLNVNKVESIREKAVEVWNK